MRTKALLLTAAISAAGLASSLAQIYSVNVVGYAQVTIKAGGFQIIANPLNAPTNTIAALFAGVTVPNSTTVYKFLDSGTYDSTTFFFGSWGGQNPNLTLAPGEGAFITVPGANNVTVTFVGDVMQGALTNAIPAGFSMKSSQVPQAGKIQTDLQYPASQGDTIYQFNPATQGYVSSQYLFGNWTGAGEPVLAIGEGVFVSKSAASSWNRTFTVSP